MVSLFMTSTPSTTATSPVTDQHLSRADLQRLVADAPAALQFERCTFDGEDLSQMDLRGATFIGCTFADTTLEAATLTSTRWLDCGAARAQLQRADCTDARWHRCDLNNTDWTRARLSSALFAEVKLTGAHFREAHTLGLEFNKLMGTDMVHVGYRGSPPALVDVMGGTVPFMFDGPATSIPLVKGGKLKALAVMSKKRNPVLPNVPTFDEAGLPDLYASSWYGLMGPAGMPPTIVNKLNAELNEALRSPEVQKRMHDLGAEIGGGTPAEFANFIQSEIARYAEIVKRSGAKFE